MWPLVTYSNYFKIFSTVTFLVSSLTNRAQLRYVSIKHCNTVSLYTINNDYTKYNICSAWFLDIVISTCLSIVLCCNAHKIYLLCSKLCSRI